MEGLLWRMVGKRSSEGSVPMRDKEMRHNPQLYMFGIHPS